MEGYRKPGRLWAQKYEEVFFQKPTHFEQSTLWNSRLANSTGLRAFFYTEEHRNRLGQDERLEAIIATVPVGHMASERVLQKIGFEKVTVDEGIGLWRKEV